MVFYVIGNGFDLHYGLKTRYKDFKEYLSNVSSETEVKMTNMFNKYDELDPEDILEWNNLEDMLSVFCNLDGEEILEEAYENAEDDDDKAAYFERPAWNVEYYTQYIDVFKEKFVEWIGKIDNKISKDDYFFPNPEDYILTFNYTNTIEDNYLINNSNILHIHGKVGENIIVGHNKYQEPILYDKSRDQDIDYRDYRAYEEVNSVLQKASKIFYKDSKKILKTYTDFFEKIRMCEKVVFLGFSCGKQDEVYAQNIISHAKYIEFFWHDEQSKENIKRIVREVNPEISLNLIKW